MQMNRRENKCSYLHGIVEYINTTIRLWSAIISIGPITCKYHVKNAKALKTASRDLFCK